MLTDSSTESPVHVLMLSIQAGHLAYSDVWTHEDERTVLYKTKLLDSTKPNTNSKNNPNLNTTLIQTLTLN